MTEVTQAQKQEIEKYQEQFEKNLQEYDNYGSKDYCRFGIYVSTNENDKNVTLVITTIKGISDTFEPYTATNNIMVEPNGNSFNLTDIYPKDYVLEYIKKLKKIS